MFDQNMDLSNGEWAEGNGGSARPGSILAGIVRATL